MVDIGKELHKNGMKPALLAKRRAMAEVHGVTSSLSQRRSVRFRRGPCRPTPTSASYSKTRILNPNSTLEPLQGQIYVRKRMAKALSQRMRKIPWKKLVRDETIDYSRQLESHLLRSLSLSSPTNLENFLHKEHATFDQLRSLFSFSLEATGSESRRHF